MKLRYHLSFLSRLCGRVGGWCKKTESAKGNHPKLQSFHLEYYLICNIEILKSGESRDGALGPSASLLLNPKGISVIPIRMKGDKIHSFEYPLECHYIIYYR